MRFIIRMNIHFIISYIPKLVVKPFCAVLTCYYYVIYSLFFQPFFSCINENSTVSIFLFFADNTYPFDFTRPFFWICQTTACYRLMILYNYYPLLIFIVIISRKLKLYRNILSETKCVCSNLIIFFVQPFIFVFFDTVDFHFCVLLLINS